MAALGMVAIAMLFHIIMTTFKNYYYISCFAFVRKIVKSKGGGRAEKEFEASPIIPSFKMALV